MARMPAAPRSTTTKQLDCWISRRSRLEVGGSLYSLRKMVYQPASWFSTSEMVPRGELHFSSSELSPAVAAPAALPVATVLASCEPIFMSVLTQPVSSMSEPAAAARASFRVNIDIDSIKSERKQPPCERKWTLPLAGCY